MVIAWIVGLTAPLFSLFDHTFSWRDLILIGGGLFLIGKATHEIHQKLEGATETVHAAASATRAATATFGAVIAQIMLLDIVFSLRSEEHTSELQSLMRISYAVFCLKKKKNDKHILYIPYQYTQTI